MKRIIFLRKTPTSPIKTQDSIWKDMKDPINVIWKMILVLIATSPIFSVYLILSYLGDFNAKIIGFSLFSNIANLGAVLSYSFYFFALFFLLVFIFPFFFGYLYDTDVDSFNTDKFKSVWNEKKIRWVIALEIVAIVIGLYLNSIYVPSNKPIFIYIFIICCYIEINALIYLIFTPNKSNNLIFPIICLFFASISSFFFLMIISIIHKHILILASINTVYTFLLFINGIISANAKKNTLKQDNKYKIIHYEIFYIIAVAVIAQISFVRIPFSKIAIRYSGLGNIQNVTFVLRAKTPICLKKQLLNTNQKNKKVKSNQCGDTNEKAAAKKTLKPKLQTTPLFLLIQTSKYFYVEKYKKDKKLNKKDIIKLPKKYVKNIIP